MNKILTLKQLLLLLFLLLFHQEGNCVYIDQRIKSEINNSLHDTINITKVDIIKRRPRVYFASTFKTINHSFSEVYELLNDYHTMPDVFKFIYTFEKIKTDTQYCENGTFYFETRAGFIRTWCILDIDSIHFNNDDCFAIYYTPNKDEKLNNQFEKKNKEILTIGIDGYYINLYIIKINENRSRVGITFIVEKPDIYIPRWLYRFLAKQWIPGLIDNIDNKLGKDTSTTENANDTGKNY